MSTIGLRSGEHKSSYHGTKSGPGEANLTSTGCQIPVPRLSTQFTSLSSQRGCSTASNESMVKIDRVITRAGICTSDLTTVSQRTKHLSTSRAEHAPILLQVIGRGSLSNSAERRFSDPTSSFPPSCLCGWRIISSDSDSIHLTTFTRMTLRLRP